MAEIGNSKYKIIYEDGILSEYYGDTLKSQRFLPMDEEEGVLAIGSVEREGLYYCYGTDNGKKNHYIPFKLENNQIKLCLGDIKFEDISSIRFGHDSGDYLGSGYPYLLNLYVSELDLTGFVKSNIVSLYSMFYRLTDTSTYNADSRKLRKINVSGWDTSNVTSIYQCFRENVNLQEIIGFDEWDKSNITNASYAFSYTKIETLNLGEWDMDKITQISYPFNACTSLTTVTGTISNLKVSIDISKSPLTNESAMVFINGLAEVTSTQTITFKASTYATLTEEQIQIATDKGWSVASA